MIDTRVASVQFQHATDDKAANFAIVRRFTAEAAEAVEATQAVEAPNAIYRIYRMYRIYRIYVYKI